MFIYKSVLISTIIYLFYKLFLQRDTYFQSIRMYFIVGISISLLLPLFIIPIYIEVAPIVPQTIIETTNFQDVTDLPNIVVTQEISKPIDWLFWLKALYITGIAFFSIKFMLELFSLLRIISISNKKRINGYIIVETNAEISPFSFFNYIVYNKSYFKTNELKSIIEHEKVHVNQKHSLDIILVQLFVVFQWFNPFVWLLKKDLQQNLEYIADKVAQEKAENNKKYQYLLLKTSIKNNPFALSNNFFNSQLKKRIIMLQKSQTKKFNQLKYVLLLPLIALFLYSFNIKEVYVVKGEESGIHFSNKVIVINAGHGGKDAGAIVNGINEKDIVLQISKKIKTLYHGDATIILARDNDAFISLNDRLDKINNINPDLVISLHLNSSSNLDENGLTTYISKDNIDFDVSEQVGNSLMAKLTNTDLKCENLTLSNLKMLRKINCPSVLIDAGYISNAKDLSYIQSKKGQNEIAHSIIDFINGKVSISKDPIFIKPIKNQKIKEVSSGYGVRVHPILKTKKMHNGIDFRAKKGTPIVAAENGTVVKAQFEENDGNVVYINHINGFQTRYAHMSKVLVKVNTQIDKGTILGEVGNTGKSVAPHLHFEILKEGKYVNPLDYLLLSKSKSKHVNSPSKYSVEKKESFFDFKLPMPIIIDNNTSKKEIISFNKQFESLDSKIRIVGVKRNKAKKITAFSIETKFKSQSKFYETMSFERLDGNIEKYLIQVRNKNKFKIIPLKDKKNYSVISEKGVKSHFFEEKSKEKNQISSSVNVLSKGDFTAVSSFEEAEYFSDDKKIKRVNSNQYKIKKGDTFYSIAKKHNTNIEILNQLNPGFNGNLVVGIWMYIKEENKDSKSFQTGLFTPKTKKRAIVDFKVLNRHNVKFYYNENEVSFKKALKIVRTKFSTIIVVEDSKNEVVKISDKLNSKTSSKINAIINKMSTDRSFSKIITLFKEMNKIDLIIHDVKRNSKNEIIEIFIDATSKTTSSTYSYVQKQPIVGIWIDYNKKLNEITIKNIEPENKTIAVTTSGNMMYKGRNYFYSINNNQITFYNKYGDEVTKNLANELIIHYNEDNNIKYRLKSGDQQGKEKIENVFTMEIRKTPDNENTKFIIVNEKKYTIDEATNFNSKIQKFRIKPLLVKKIKMSNIKGSLKEGVSIKFTDEKDNKERVIEIVESSDNEKPIITKMGWIFYNVGNIDFRGFYYVENRKMLFFDKNGAQLSTNLSEKILKVLYSN